VYLPAAEIEKHQLEDALRMVKAYDPTWEFVAALLKTHNRDYTYRLRVRSEQWRTKVTGE